MLVVACYLAAFAAYARFASLISKAGIAATTARDLELTKSLGVQYVTGSLIFFGGVAASLAGL